MNNKKMNNKKLKRAMVDLLKVVEDRIVDIQIRNYNEIWRKIRDADELDSFIESLIDDPEFTNNTHLLWITADAELDNEVFFEFNFGLNKLYFELYVNNRIYRFFDEDFSNSTVKIDDRVKRIIIDNMDIIEK